jgi:carbon-monoxide dehydrogenase medium subunit
MLLPKFEFHEPESIEKALVLKKQFNSGARFLAGGTDLLVYLKKKIVSTDHVISLQRIAGLSEIQENDSDLIIGACTTMAAISRHPVVQKRFGALKSGADNMGTHLIRNRATIGGNVCNASPAGDTLPALLVYDAVALVESPDGKREIPLTDFFKGPGKTDLKNDDILTGFRLPYPPDHSGAHYIQLGKRKSAEINVVNAAAFLTCDSGTGNILSVRIALGSVAPTPIRAPLAEAALMGSTAGDDAFNAAAEIARFKDCAPIDDFRGSAAYRRAMVGILTKRTLAAAFDQARA